MCDICLLLLFHCSDSTHCISHVGESSIGLACSANGLLGEWRRLPYPLDNIQAHWIILDNIQTQLSHRILQFTLRAHQLYQPMRLPPIIPLP